VTTTQQAPSGWIKRHNPLWYPAFQDGRGHQLRSLRDIAGRPVEPREMAGLLKEIRQCSLRTLRSLRVGTGNSLRIGTDDGTFSPSDLGILSFWLDMQDGASYTNSAGACSAFINKKSGVSWAQATSGNRPAISATAINGFNGLDFNDASQHHIISTETAVLTAINMRARACIYVAKHDVADASDAAFGFGNSAEVQRSSGYFGVSTSATGTWVNARNNSDDVNNNRDSVGGSDTSPHVFDHFSTTTYTALRVDGADVLLGTGEYQVAHTSVYGSLSADRCAIGCSPRATPTSFLDGKIGEILLYGGIPSITAHMDAISYLGAKWGITVA
jgi:hypothetical protein